MSLKFDTSTPNALLKAFKEAIDAKHVITWTYDKDGDFTHNTDQWRNRAWLRPTVYEGTSLNFRILIPDAEKQQMCA